MEIKSQGPFPNAEGLYKAVSYSLGSVKSVQILGYTLFWTLTFNVPKIGVPMPN